MVALRVSRHQGEDGLYFSIHHHGSTTTLAFDDALELLQALHLVVAGGEPLYENIAHIEAEAERHRLVAQIEARERGSRAEYRIPSRPQRKVGIEDI